MNFLLHNKCIVYAIKPQIKKHEAINNFLLTGSIMCHLHLGIGNSLVFSERTSFG